MDIKTKYNYINKLSKLEVCLWNHHITTKKYSMKLLLI